MSYQYINPTYLAQNFQGDNTFITEILDIFIEEVPPKLRGLQDRWRLKQWEAMKEDLHSVKATIKTIGAHAMHQQVEQLEARLCNADKIEEIPGMIDHIKQQLPAVMEEVMHYRQSLIKV